MREDMEWYVYVEDFNNHCIEKHNVFDHTRFVEDIKKIYKKHKDNFDIFSEEVRKSLMYFYWSKCEWEIVLSPWPPRENFKEEKIDVYEQVMLNWDNFIKYVWEMTHARKVVKK